MKWLAMLLKQQKNIKLYKIKNLNDIYSAKKQLVSFSKKMQKFDKTIKSFLKQKMYFHKDVNSKTNYGRKVITGLFLQLKKTQKNILISKNTTIQI